MTRLLFPLLFAASISAFGQSKAIYSDGHDWNQSIEVGRQIEGLHCACMPKNLGLQIATAAHMSFLEAMMEDELRIGPSKHLYSGHSTKEIMQAIDLLYRDPKNLPIPIYSAYQHVGLQFSGAAPQALAADLEKLRKANP